jgi:hypothetical protein
LAGSYTSVAHLAAAHHVPLLRLVPAGIDGGLLGTVLLDIDEPESTDCEWHHRWVVRMHKVRHWHPALGQHKVIYRGPYIKGPPGKPLLGAEKIRGPDTLAPGNLLGFRAICRAD